MVKKEEVARFHRTQIYKDIELGLHNLLTKKRDAVARPLSSPAQHYYTSFSRPPNTVSDDESDRYADEEHDCAPPCPVLGQDMKFKICQREHPDGKVCADRGCFIPNGSARKYMRGFIKNVPRQSRSISRLRPVAHGLVSKYCSNLSSKDIEVFSSIVRLLFTDLRDAGQRNWVPEVHGVLNWKSQPFETWVGEFMTEIHGARCKRDMAEYL